jgi:hypothetical protein
LNPITGTALAIGAGSSLFDVFDKAIQTYKLYSTAKSLANTSALLVAKILIEECRLTQWGDGLDIRSVAEQTEGDTRELDERLRGNNGLYQTALQALASIEDTLTDIDGLTAKYGLQIFEESISENENLSKNKIILPLRPGHIANVSGLTEAFETLKGWKGADGLAPALPSLLAPRTKWGAVPKCFKGSNLLEYEVIWGHIDILVVAVRRLSRRWKVKTLLAGPSPTSPMKAKITISPISNKISYLHSRTRKIFSRVPVTVANLSCCCFTLS